MLTMFAGDSLIIEVPVRNRETRLPVDLTGATSIRWHLSTNRNTRPALVTKSLDSGVSIADASGGIFEVPLVPADTEDLAGDYYHEAEVILADGSVATVFAEPMKITPTLIKP